VITINTRQEGNKMSEFYAIKDNVTTQTLCKFTWNSDSQFADWEYILDHGCTLEPIKESARFADRHEAKSAVLKLNELFESQGEKVDFSVVKVQSAMVEEAITMSLVDLG